MTKARKRVTLKDVALDCGFTINTVSRALKDKDDISSSTKRLVLRTAKRLGYISDEIAGSLRSGRTRTVALVLGDISSPFFAIRVMEIESELRKYGYAAFIINTQEDEHRELEAVQSAIGRKVDGVILSPSLKTQRSVVLLRRNSIPFVLLGRHFKRLDTDFVDCDNTKGGRLATEHLLAKGHRRVLLLNGPRHLSSACERELGYLHAHRRYGIIPAKTLRLDLEQRSGSVACALTERLAVKADFSAIFCFSDMMALEAISVLVKRGFKVPADVAVVGFDNIQAHLFFPVPLTTVGAPKGLMVKKAIDILMQRIDGPALRGFKQEIVDVELVIRETA